MVCLGIAFGWVVIVCVVGVSTVHRRTDGRTQRKKADRNDLAATCLQRTTKHQPRDVRRWATLFLLCYAKNCTFRYSKWAGLPCPGKDGSFQLRMVFPFCFWCSLGDMIRFAKNKRGKKLNFLSSVWSAKREN